MTSKTYPIEGYGKALIVFGLFLAAYAFTLRIAEELATQGFSPSEYFHAARAGSVFVSGISSSILISCGFLVMVRDRSDAEIQILLRIDTLTGAFNRQHLKEAASQEILRVQRMGYPLSMVLVDIDHFKSINDTYGHIVGDKVLKAFSDELKSSLRTSDRLYRFGGEEFLMLLYDTDLDGATVLASKIREAIQNHVFPNQIRLTASFGCASFDTEDSFESWLQRADHALYAAKRSGRNRIAKSG